MVFLVVLFGLLSGCLLAVLVGMVGASRRIGFGWSFLISLIFTPLIGLICVLLSDSLPSAEPRRWGCLGSLVAILGLLFLVACLMLLFGVALV
jgi:hypothetical protein